MIKQQKGLKPRRRKREGNRTEARTSRGRALRAALISQPNGGEGGRGYESR